MTRQGNIARWMVMAVLVVPIMLYLYLRFGADHKFDRVPFQYEITTNGDSAIRRLPVFSMVSTDGDTITDEDLKGNICFIMFASGEPDPENKVMVMHGLLKRLYDNVEWDRGVNLRLVTFHTGDSTAQFATFADTLGVGEGWLFLSGNPQATQAVGEAAGITAFTWDTTSTAPVETYSVVLVDKEGRFRSLYGNGMDWGNERKMEEDYITLMRLEYPEELEK
ncbi:hypothetical protein [Pontibacter sp. G13]|uniref:SCO family protein n=1 Tax=Pontibacter sp. G13 TaxID=3074898 RepID=UPI00288ABC89|nr:hypothetical protein [Pontibacter sp. G13]WNJ16611.1 hypothetical protein RJD25_17235 [Pontibacter sp. G13]